MALENGGKVSRDLEARIIARAWQEESFKQELLRDPKGLLERQYGITLPEGVELRVHEETPSALHVVLPTDPSRKDTPSSREFEPKGTAAAAAANPLALAGQRG